MISLHDVYKHYLVGDKIINALNGISLEINSSGLILITGESGSGKSTLLNILSFNDRITSGSYCFENRDIDLMSQDDLDAIRRESFGYISQDYSLFENETVEKNIEYSAVLIEPNKVQRKKLVAEVIEELSIGPLKNKKVSHLSGGEKQRVAIARAVVKKPKVIFADEITSNLDEESSIIICKLLSDIAKKQIVIVVTHDEELFDKYADQKIVLSDGKISKNKLINKNRKIDTSSLENHYDYKKSWFFCILKNFSYILFLFLFSFISLFAPLVIYDATTDNLNSNYSYTTRYASPFKNISKERNIIIKNDKTSFNVTDYDYFKKLEGFKTIMPQDVLLDTFFVHKSVYKNIESKSEILIRPLEEIDKVHSGVMPKTDYEVVTNSQTIFAEATSFISLNDTDYYQIKEVGTYFTNGEDQNGNNGQIYYLSNNLIKTLFADFSRAYNLHLIDDGDKEIQSTNIFCSDQVEKGCVVTSNEKYDNKYLNISINSGSYINKMNNLKVIVDNERKIIDRDNRFDDVFVFNNSDYVETVNDNFTQISVFSNNRIFSTDKYNVFYPNINKGQPSIEKLLFFILFTLLFVALVIVISFVTLLIINKISKAEINNYIILKTIGYSDKQNLTRLIIRSATPIVLSTITNILLFISFNILSNYAKSTGNATLSAIFIGALSTTQIILIPIVFMLVFLFILLNNIIKKYKAGLSRIKVRDD